jgi:hypothetical protein
MPARHKLQMRTSAKNPMRKLTPVEKRLGFQPGDTVHEELRRRFGPYPRLAVKRINRQIEEYRARNIPPLQ